MDKDDRDRARDRDRDSQPITDLEEIVRFQ